MATLHYRDPADQSWKTLDGPAGPTGAIGPTGPAGPTVVSADANNTATLGTDGLVYVPGVDTTAMDTQFVNLAGDTMTGELSLVDQVTVPPPVVPTAVAARGYVDQVITVSDMDPVGLPARDGLIWNVVGEEVLALPPTQVVGTWINPTESRVTWVDTAPNDPTITGYEVYSNLIGSPVATTDTLLGTVSPGTQVFIHTKDADAQAASKVFYGVRAVNPAGPSDLVETNAIPRYVGEDPDSSWLPFTVVPDEQRIELLTLVDPAGTQDVIFRVITSDGSSYTVDWGDGSAAAIVPSTTNATHTYTGSTLSGNPSSSDGKAQALASVSVGIGSSITGFKFAEGTFAGFTAAIVGCSLSDFGGNQSGEAAPQTIRHLSALAPLNVVSARAMFESMRELRAVPHTINCAGVTDFTFMFHSCTNLPAAPYMDTSSATIMTSMFWSCEGLKFVPLYNTSNVTTMENMFLFALSIESVPPFNTSEVTTMASIFKDCVLLVDVPLFDTSKVGVINGGFRNCQSLRTIPALDLSAATNIDSIFDDCPNIESIEAYGFTSAFSVANTNLDTAALDLLFTNLGDVSGFVTLYITGTPGAATCDRTIAEAKGWRIVA